MRWCRHIHCRLWLSSSCWFWSSWIWLATSSSGGWTWILFPWSISWLGSGKRKSEKSVTAFKMLPSTYFRVPLFDMLRFGTFHFSLILDHSQSWKSLGSRILRCRSWQLDWWSTTPGTWPTISACRILPCLARRGLRMDSEKGWRSMWSYLCRSEWSRCFLHVVFSLVARPPVFHTSIYCGVLFICECMNIIHASFYLCCLSLSRFSFSIFFDGALRCFTHKKISQPLFYFGLVVQASVRNKACEPGGRKPVQCPRGQKVVG